METPDLSPPACGRPFYGRFGTVARRVLFFGSVVLVNAAASLWLADLFWRMSWQKAHYPLLAVFIVLNGLLVLGSFHAIFGACAMLTGRSRAAVRITRLADGKTGPLRCRHAVVMPVYNGTTQHFCARIEAIYRSIMETGNLDSFDFFILSNTRDLDLWVMEEAAWTNLCRRLGGFGRIYYRRRKTNENRKAGNIGDFVRTWGGAYESMLVLDADSLMDGADIVTMARIMEDYPRLGILPDSAEADPRGLDVHPAPTICHAPIRAAVHTGPEFLATCGRQLLGSQRADPPEAVFRILRAASASGA